MVSKKAPTKELHVNVKQENYDWLISSFPREASQVVDNMIEDLKNKNERSELIRRKMFNIPERLRIQDGYVEYSPGRWCEEKAFWKIDHIIKKMEASKLPREKEGVRQK